MTHQVVVVDNRLVATDRQSLSLRVLGTTQCSVELSWYILESTGEPGSQDKVQYMVLYYRFVLKCS